MIKLIVPAVFFFALASARAQEPPLGPTVEELSQLLLQQKEIIDAQIQELEALRKRLSDIEALALSSHNRLQELEQRPAEPSVGEAVERRLAEIEQQVQRIPEAPAEVVDAGEFPGSIPIPGTDAAVKVGGQVRLTLVKTLGPLGVDDKFVTSLIPVEGSQEAGKGSRLTFSARPSRLNFDFRSPTGVGSVRAFMEADFAGGSANSFRLRHAYGQWGSFLGRQTWSTFSDPEAEPDGIDFEGTERDLSFPAASDPMDQDSS
ncbi:MAG: DcaP family trimeric outer membrane transporter [Vicinamibacteria bacterium]